MEINNKILNDEMFDKMLEETIDEFDQKEFKTQENNTNKDDQLNIIYFNDENKNNDQQIKIYNNYDTLTLAGGSTKGIMILGALQYASDNYLLKDIKNYIGTSAGAMIGYLLAIGYTPIEMMIYICCNQLLEKMLHFNIVAMINGQGASSFNHIQENLEKMTIQKIGFFPTLKDLKDKFGKTLICTTYNLTKNIVEYLSYENYPNLPCLTAVRMSSNLPLIFENYKYGDSLYTDGGIADNFPIQIADNIGNKILGILLTSSEKNFSNDPDIGILEFIYKLICISTSQSEKYKIKNVSSKCKIVKLFNDKLKVFDFDINSKDKLELFSSGYQQLKEQLE
jgi:predicted acylesterase/phospholipase RssA